MAVRPADRPAYIAALQAVEVGQGTEAFEALLWARLGATLAERIAALRMALPPA